jgi:hypothetical protein
MNPRHGIEGYWQLHWVAQTFLRMPVPPDMSVVIDPEWLSTNPSLTLRVTIGERGKTWQPEALARPANLGKY